MSGDSPPLMAHTQDAPNPLGRTLLETVVRPLAIAAMMACIAISLSQFVVTVVPTWPGAVFVTLVFCASLESIHAQRLLGQRRMETKDRLRFRFVEWVVILLIVRFALYLGYGGERLVRDLAAWSTNAGSFFDPLFLIVGLLIVAFWATAALLARTAEELEASPMEMLPDRTDLDGYLRSTMPRHGSVDRSARVSHIVSVFFVGGAIMLLFAGLSRVDVRELILLEHSPSSGVILNILIYFVTGFLLISQARYTTLKASWQIENIPVLGQLSRRWLILATGFLVIIGLVAAILPVRYSVGMIGALSTAIRWILYILVQIALFLMFIVTYAFGWLLSLLFRRQPPAMDRMQRIAPPAMTPTAAAAGTPAWWQLLSSLIFWTVILGIVGYSLFHFVVYRWDLIRKLSGKRVWQWLAAMWLRLRTGSERLGRRLREQVRERLERRRQAAAKRWRYVSLRRMSPRDRVRYFYLSTVRRGTGQGVPRKPSATPLEYASILASELPDSASEVDELTRSFVEARYSEHSVTAEDARTIQRVWTRIKRALLRRKRHASGSDSDSDE